MASNSHTGSLTQSNILLTIAQRSYFRLDARTSGNARWNSIRSGYGTFRLFRTGQSLFTTHARAFPQNNYTICIHLLLLICTIISLIIQLQLFVYILSLHLSTNFIWQDELDSYLLLTSSALTKAVLLHLPCNFWP
jgi:hypothetical protein